MDGRELTARPATLRSPLPALLGLNREGLHGNDTEAWDRAVTGSAGFIGGWVVRRLLDKGYRVRACVRDADDPARTTFLRQLPGYVSGRLTLHGADLDRAGCFDDAFAGCHGVCHVSHVSTVPRSGLRADGVRSHHRQHRQIRNRRPGDRDLEPGHRADRGGSARVGAPTGALRGPATPTRPIRTGEIRSGTATR